MGGYSLPENSVPTGGQNQDHPRGNKKAHGLDRPMEKEEKFRFCGSKS
jgi:hypothetical protein